MTRDEYRKLVLDECGKTVSVEYVMRPINFVHVLQDIAKDAFLHPGKYSRTLQDETRRRLLQLNEQGFTDP